MLSRCGCNDGQVAPCCRCRDSHMGTLETPVTIDKHPQTQYPPVTGWRCGNMDRARTGVGVGEEYRAAGLHWLSTCCPYKRQLYLVGSCAPTHVQASPQFSCVWKLWDSSVVSQSLDLDASHVGGQLLWKESDGLSQLRALLKELPSFLVSASSCGMMFISNK